MTNPHDLYDAIVIGSGFGGSMAAHVLVNAGQRVLMLERGDWVARGPENWEPEGVGQLTRHYSMETPYRVVQHGGPEEVGGYFCVGGPSVFYGGVSLRFRAEDFESDPAITGGSGARWPFRYAELEPYYTEAERIIGIAGEAGVDPTEPSRSAPYPQRPAALAPTSEMIQRAAAALGLHPFPLPLAINHAAASGRESCRACDTCDGFACAIGAKNDLATVVLPPLLAKGMQLRPNTLATALTHDGRRVTAVECVNTTTGERSSYRGRRVILAAGALATPHLLLASGLHRLNPGGHTVGRYLMRHYNEIVFGLFARAPGSDRRFHKQLGIHDFYFGHPTIRRPTGKLGSLQQLPTPPAALVRAELPPLIGRAVTPLVRHLTGLLIIAEDQPQYENRVTLDPVARDRYGMPRLIIRHHYSERDLAAGLALVGRAKAILRRAGALITYRHKILTFSHAVGTVRMGSDPQTSALDEFSQFRGVENLSVLDASVMPTSAATNPSLTIAATALRAATRIAGEPLSRPHAHARAASHG